MPSTIEAQVKRQLAEKGETLEGLFAKNFESVKLTWQDVLQMTDEEPSERTVRRWLNR